jgi:hypothetical protein
VYQHDLEHARHWYLKTRGFDFAALEEQGIPLVRFVDASPLRNGQG